MTQPKLMKMAITASLTHFEVIFDLTVAERNPQYVL